MTSTAETKHRLGFARNGTTSFVTGGWWRAPWATGWERVPGSDHGRDFYRRAVQCALAGPNAEERWMCRQFGCPIKPRSWWRGRLAFKLEQGHPVHVTRSQAEALMALHAAGWPDSTGPDRAAGLGATASSQHLEAE